MNIEKIKISELHVNPNNTRKHGDKQVSEFVRSIEQFGVIRPMVVDEDGVVWVGNGLLMALQRMGVEEAECIVMRNMDSKTKTKLMLADNQIATLGMDDFDVIDRLMRDMQDFDIPGYNSEDLEMIYGASGIAESMEQFKRTDEQQQRDVEKHERVERGDYTPPPAVEQQRQEVEQKQRERRFIICPECGAKVYVD